ncbi:MAG: hypothetical protein IK018_04670 [Lachnospiraceae bacterium]|nr:hypothetical protein [Lachnospiraceae bacterium]
MTTDRFAEYVLSEHERIISETSTDIAKAADRDYLVSGISQTDLQSPVTRKLAAVILHRAMQRLTHEEDEDWGIAKGFRDIYDCRICANAVAQVAVKGILPPEADNFFGMTDVLTDEKASKTIIRLYNKSQRITKLLEL